VKASVPEAVVVCISSAPDAAAAERIARTLVEERLVACANLVPGVVSVFRWEGEVRREDEVVLWMKARRSAVARLKERLPELHPYEVPELLVCEVQDGLERYCSWIVEETVGD
jgi:periplasmic divalent cation tolerance protein